MGNTYPTYQPSGQTINAQSVGSMRTPPSVFMDVANDNQVRKELPRAANDNNWRWAARTTNMGVQAIGRLARIHPAVRALTAAVDALAHLERGRLNAELFWTIGSIAGNPIDRLSWDSDFVEFADGKMTLKQYPLNYKRHNLMPSTTFYPANSTADYPPGIDTGIGLQAVNAPAFPSRTRGYWATREIDNPNAWLTTNRYAWLWGYRLTTTSNSPEGWNPPTELPVRPLRYAPTVEPYFTPFPETSPLLARPLHAPIPIWGIGTRPGREVGPRPNPRPVRPQPPPTKTKERKFAIAVGGIWAQGINFATESLDLIQALYDSLPQWLRNKLWKEHGGFMNPYDKSLAVLTYFHLIDGEKLIFNLLDMNSEDQTYGKIGGHVKNANRNLIGGGGIQLGDAL